MKIKPFQIALDAFSNWVEIILMLFESICTLSMQKSVWELQSMHVSKVNLNYFFRFHVKKMRNFADPNIFRGRKKLGRDANLTYARRSPYMKMCFPGCECIGGPKETFRRGAEGTGGSVHNLSISKFITYFVHNLFVHNTGMRGWARTFRWRIKHPRRPLSLIS